MMVSSHFPFFDEIVVLIHRVFMYVHVPVKWKHYSLNDIVISLIDRSKKLIEYLFSFNMS